MRRLRRFLLGLLGTAVIVVAGYVVWVVGLGRFAEDYCITGVDPPADAAVISGPEWEFPTTYRCDYGPAGTITATELAPAIFSSVLSGSVLLLVAGLWWVLVWTSPAAVNGHAARAAAPARRRRRGAGAQQP